MAGRTDRMTMKVGDKYHTWHLDKIWQETRDLPVVDVEIESLKHLDAVCWFNEDFPATLRNVIYHFMRLEKVNTDYPIILDPTGQLFDGAHRVARAMANGQTTIRAVRMLEVPPPDEIVDSIVENDSDQICDE